MVPVSDSLSSAMPDLFDGQTGLGAAGGLAASDTDDFSYGIFQVAGRMLQVVIGISIGLLFSMTIVYMFGKKKRSGLFVF